MRHYRCMSDLPDFTLHSRRSVLNIGCSKNKMLGEKEVGEGERCFQNIRDT